MFLNVMSPYAFICSLFVNNQGLMLESVLLFFPLVIIVRSLKSLVERKNNLHANGDKYLLKKQNKHGNVDGKMV